MRKLVTLLGVLLTFALVVCASEPLALAEETSAELCNGQDDDGDGLVDEDWPIGKECWSGYGPCRQLGKWECGLEDIAICVVKPADRIDPEPEDCDGIDNDCDGLVDNNIMTQCYVVSEENKCNVGRVICTAPNITTCIPIPPTDEICGNDFDEDCNGIAEICIGGEDAGVGGGDLPIDTEKQIQLGTPCRPTYFKDEAMCSYTPPSPHPLLPLSTVLVVVGAATLISRRRRLL